VHTYFFFFYNDNVKERALKSLKNEMEEIKMKINIRKDDSFVEDSNWHQLHNTYENFINSNIDKKLVLIELGVGFNTPGIIRFPFERLAYEYENVTLIRVNDRYTNVAYELENNTNVITMKEDCATFIQNILKY
jgi:hypothetical protein